MNIKINKKSVTPVYKQIANSIKQLILEGELVNGYKLPSERQLAEEIEVHRNTVIKAYGVLIDEGMIVSSRVSPRGYFVMKSEHVEKANVFFQLAKMIRYNFSAKEKTFQQIFDDARLPEYISLGGIIMDSEISPARRMAPIFDKMKETCWSGKTDSMQYDEVDRLKHNICELMKKQNMYINKKNVQLVSDSTQALNHIADLYLNEGDCIIAEEPILPDTVNLFRNKGVEIVGVSMEADGPNMKVLELLCIERKPKFIYVMPNYHNPTSVVMSLEKRLKLIEISNKYGISIIEDDFQGDFNYSSKGLLPLYALDRYKSVLYIGTFNLAFLPGIKTAFVLGPYEPIYMIGQYIKMSQVYISNIGQYMLNEFIESGEYEDYLMDMRAFYARKRDLLAGKLERLKGKGIDFTVPEGGLYIWCTLDSKINEKEIFEKCRSKGLLIMPGYLFYPEGYQGNGHLRLCFSNIADPDIENAVLILEEAIDDIMSEMNED